MYRYSYTLYTHIEGIYRVGGTMRGTGISENDGEVKQCPTKLYQILIKCSVVLCLLCNGWLGEAVSVLVPWELPDETH